jgi:hypothetical protein
MDVSMPCECLIGDLPKEKAMDLCLSPGATRAQMVDRIQNHIVARTELLALHASG